MKLSAPIHGLKRKARLIRRTEAVPLHAALDRIANEEGFQSWSLLMAKRTSAKGARGLLARLVPGDLVIVAGRPGQGKTLLSLSLAADAVKAGRQSALFSLEYTVLDVAARLRAIGIDPQGLGTNFIVDCSDAIDAAYIIGRLASTPGETLVVIDYLQLLDQRRDTPALAVQVGMLRSFAKQRGLILVFVSQIDRAYELSGRPFPEMTDIRLPNPLDLRLFDKACMVNQGEVRFQPTP